MISYVLYYPSSRDRAHLISHNKCFYPIWETKQKRALTINTRVIPRFNEYILHFINCNINDIL